MRRPLRHTLGALRNACVEVSHVREASKHTILENGGLYRVPKGNYPRQRLERGLRSFVRRLAERMESRP
jgi:hypothetical protein